VIGMGHGSVWVNSHNLGRYPERIPAHGLYIPECWLSTNNTLVIFDEDGRTPQGVTIQSEPEASRYAIEYTAR
jgi:beta-galactosidase